MYPQRILLIGTELKGKGKDKSHRRFAVGVVDVRIPHVSMGTAWEG